jgi:hypothetical protein
MSDEDGAALVIKTGIEQLFAPFHDLLDKLQRSPTNMEKALDALPGRPMGCFGRSSKHQIRTAW